MSLSRFDLGLRQELATREHLVGHGLADVVESATVPASSTTLPISSTARLEVDVAIKLGEELSESLAIAELDQQESMSPASDSTPAAASQAISPGRPALAHPVDLSARLYSNPALAALRSPAAIPLPLQRSNPTYVQVATPHPSILANPKCSGYFVEPVRGSSSLGSEKA